MRMTDSSNTRIAWLVPISAFYWQHALSEMARIYPSTRLFTASWPGYARGYENLLEYEIVGNVKIVDKAGKAERDLGYSEFLKILSPKIVVNLLKYQPDVVFTASFGIWTILALIFKYIGGWQVIISYEGSSPRVDYTSSPLRLWLRRLMVKASDGCLTNTQSGRKYLVNTLWANSRQVFNFPHEIPSLKSLTVEHNGLSLVANMPEAGSKVKFLFVGQIIPRKGLQHLLNTCQLLINQDINDFTISIIGDGPERQNLEEYCEVNGLSKYISWLGRIDYDQLGNHFIHSDVFVFPTLEDTWGMVILEAMLLGKPILASKLAGAAELVIEGENGFTFVPTHPTELAVQMTTIIRNPDLILSMGENSKKIMSNYSAKKTALRLEQLVNLITSKGHHDFPFDI